jgi:hypothetical protein
MSLGWHRGLAALLTGGLMAFAGVVQAQPPGGGRGMPMGYDKAKEVTLTGTVAAVEEHQGMGMGTGTHLKLTVGADTLDVHLGPTRWLADHQYSFAAGDQITVTGSRTAINGVDSLIARQIDKAGTVIKLRDENGRPLWAGRRMGR